MTSESMSFVVVILLEDWAVFAPWTGGLNSSPPPDGAPGDHVGGEPTTGDHSWGGGQTETTPPPGSPSLQDRMGGPGGDHSGSCCGGPVDRPLWSSSTLHSHANGELFFYNIEHQITMFDNIEQWITMFEITLSSGYQRSITTSSRYQCSISKYDWYHCSRYQSMADTLVHDIKVLLISMFAISKYGDIKVLDIKVRLI